MSRRIARQTALQTLFQLDIAEVKAQPDIDSVLEDRLSQVSLETQDSEYVALVVRGVMQHMQELDRWINSCSLDWKVQRLARVDRNILRLAIFEIRFLEDVPMKVSVNEAVDLAKRFSDAQSPKFVNGILGSVVSLSGGD